MRAKQCRSLLLLTLIVVAWATTDVQRASTPALLWGSQNFFGPAATRVNYESLLLSDVWNGLVKSYKESEGGTVPEITVVFVGNQMRPSDLGEMKPVQSALKESSALLYPNTFYEGTGDDFARVLAENGDVDAKLVGSCATDEAGQNIEEALKAAFAKSSSKDNAPKVVVVCSASDTLSGELVDFGIVMSALEGASKEYITLYVSHESDSEGLSGAKRALLSNTANKTPKYTVCEGLCLTQVKFLEGIILALVLALALAAGLCCTHILDGPSQFEKAEGESTQ